MRITKSHGYRLAEIVLACKKGESEGGVPNRLQHAVDAFNTDESKPYRLSLSWGMTVYDPQTARSLDQLISAADELMYAQKKSKYPGGI